MSQENQVKAKAAPCKRCYGTGVISCFACSGQGKKFMISYGYTTSAIPCSACRGTGIKRVCDLCGGIEK